MDTRRSLWNRISSMSAVGFLLVLTIIISIFAFVVFIVSPESIAFFALQPESIASGRFLWTLILHVFVHAGPLHLFVNMFVLVSLGSLSERIIGRKRFLILYFAGGLGAGILAVLAAILFGNGFGEKFVGSPESFMVGASGAIFAIAGLLMVLLPKLRFSIIFLPFFSLPAYIMVPLVLIVTWILSILAGWNVGNVAHVGGFLIGAVFGAYLRATYRRKVELLQRYFR